MQPIRSLEVARMVRIVKDADVRRGELLDTALALFLANGYERTSVEQITSAVGVAKGTFYHYFRTKSDLLEQLVERFTDDLFGQVEVALAVTEGSALDRFRALMAASTAAKTGRKDETLMISSSLYSDDNRALLSSLREGWIERTRPFISAIIEQGVAEGTFDVPDACAMTEVWLSLWYDFGLRVGELYSRVQDHPACVDQLVGQMNALFLAQERILGAPPGSLDMDIEGALARIVGKEGGR